MNKTVKPLAAMATVGAIILAVTVSGANAGYGRSPYAPACLSTAGGTAACQLIIDYFGALNAGRSQKACSFLGQKLRLETGGPDCPHVLAMSQGTPFQIVGARSVPSGDVVLVKVGFHELNHFRMLSWAALVGRRAGQPRILDTQRT